MVQRKFDGFLHSICDLLAVQFVQKWAKFKSFNHDIKAVQVAGSRVRNVKFATYMKFATCGNANKINDLR